MALEQQLGQNVIPTSLQNPCPTSPMCLLTPKNWASAHFFPPGLLKQMLCSVSDVVSQSIFTDMLFSELQESLHHRNVSGQG